MVLLTLEPIVLDGEAAMVAFGGQLSRCFRGGAVVFLKGTLGAGKTTLCRGVLQGLGHSGAVKSPTYTLVEPYELRGIQVFHFDLYRLGDPEELEFMGVRDYFASDSLCLLEWPERGEGYLPIADIEIDIQVAGKCRKIIIAAATERGQQLLQAVRLGE